MAHEEDECDSSSLFAVASQSDVTSFLHKQAAKITGLNSSISDDDDDDDESSIDDNFIRNNNLQIKKPYLSRSCFASISSQKQNLADDLTELNWLTTFKLKEFQDKKNNNEDQISKLSNELKTYDNQNTDSISCGVIIFLALYSKRDHNDIPWSLTIKQLYEYIQINNKKLTNKRGWKNLLKQTLITIPCFVKTKHDTLKSSSIWTIDPYYRPLLTKAYLTSLSLQTNKIISDEKQSESIVNNFAPKATVKTKALPRLYERLCEEKTNNQDGDEADSNHIIKHQHSPILDGKRTRSVSSTAHQQFGKNNDKKYLSSSASCTTKLNKRNHSHLNIESKTSTPNKRSNSITRVDKQKKRMKSTESIEYNKNESIIDEDDECDSSLSTRTSRKSIITTRSQTAAQNIKNDFVHRRKSSPPKKRLSLGLSTHRPNTRINKKNIEQDLELLRQAQPHDFSSNRTSIEKTSTEDVLDLSVSR